MTKGTFNKILFIVFRIRSKLFPFALKIFNYGSITLPGILGIVYPAMLQSTAQDGQGDPTRLVARNVGLQLVHRPNVVKDVLDNVGVRAVVCIVCHVVGFGFFFIVSKERVAKDYSSVKQRISPDYFPTTYILLNL